MPGGGPVFDLLARWQDSRHRYRDLDIAGEIDAKRKRRSREGDSCCISAFADE
jgi:hypothetical protein